MKNFTKRWKDYIYENYEDFLVEYDIRCYIMKRNYEETLIEYSEELVKEKFDVYYQNKKKYVESYDYLEREFGVYEEIQLLTYEEEFANFKNRIETYSKSLKEQAIQVIGDLQKEDNINVTIADVEKVDFRLATLNLCNGVDYRVIGRLRLTNDVMGFLTGMTKNAEDKGKMDYIKFDNSNIWFHDARVLEVNHLKLFHNNDITIILHDNETYCKIVMVNGNTNISKISNLKISEPSINRFNFLNGLRAYYYDVNTYEYGYCDDIGYYLRLEELEFWGDDIIITKL